MNTLSFFGSFAFLSFAVAGFWRSVHAEDPSLKDQAIRGISPVIAKEGTAFLLYRFPDGRISLCAADGNITNNYSRESQVIDGAVGTDLFALLAGSTPVASVQVLMGSRRWVRFYNRLTGRSKSRRILGTILGAITGYSLGSFLGREWALRPDSKRLGDYLTQKDNWASILESYSLTKVRTTKDAVDDLPRDVRQKLAPALSEAENSIIALRAAGGVTLKNEVEALRKMDAAVAPHYGLVRGYAERFSQDAKDAMIVFGYACIGAVFLFLSLGTFSVLRERIKQRSK